MIMDVLALLLSTVGVSVSKIFEWGAKLYFGPKLRVK
jgi:hypothetical protein